MFPTPIQKYSIPVNIIYRVALLVTLFIWLMPLIAVMLTSIRTYDDILAGNYWGWPKEIAAIENYSYIFEDGRMARYFLNSMIITLPTVFGTLLFSSMAGFSLAMHKFKLNILLFCMFIAGNFVPFQILMIPVRGLTLHSLTVMLISLSVAPDEVRCDSVLARTPPAIVMSLNDITACPLGPYASTWRLEVFSTR